MIKISFKDIKEFLLVKRFKGVELEIDKMLVEELLGIPIEHEPQKKKNYEIYSYGIFQIFLFDKKVKGFSFDYQKHPYYENYFEYSPLDKELIFKYLEENKIGYSEELLLKTDFGSSFKTTNGISLAFINDKLIAFGIIDICL